MYMYGLIPSQSEANGVHLVFSGGIVALQSLLSLVGIPGVVGLIALEGLLGFSFPFYPFYPYNTEYHYG